MYIKILYLPLVKHTQKKKCFILNKRTLFHKGHSSGHTYHLPFEIDGKKYLSGSPFFLKFVRLFFVGFFFKSLWVCASTVLGNQLCLVDTVNRFSDLAS